MSETRYIKVEWCKNCPRRNYLGMYDRGQCREGINLDREENFPAIPISCPLPKLPSVKDEDFVRLMDDHLRNVDDVSLKRCLKDWLKSIGVEVRDERD